MLSPPTDPHAAARLKSPVRSLPRLSPMLRQDSSALCALFPDCSQCARQPHDESFCDLCDDRASPGWDGTAAHGTSRCLAHDARDGARLSSVHLVVAPNPFSHKPEGFSLPPQCPGPGMNTPLFVIDSESVLQLVGEACGTWWHAAVAISLGHHNGHRLWDCLAPLLQLPLLLQLAPSSSFSSVSGTASPSVPA